MWHRPPTPQIPRCESTQGEDVGGGVAVLIGVGINASPTFERSGGTTPRARCNTTLRAILAYDIRILDVVLIEDQAAGHLLKVENDEAQVIQVLVLIDQDVVLEHRVGDLLASQKPFQSLANSAGVQVHVPTGEDKGQT